MRRIGSTFLLSLGLLLALPSVDADTLLVESVQSSQSVARPAHGMTMDQVLQNYGEPSRRLGPVGEPPISHWVYPDFVVYFEGDHVIHSVVPPHH
ncbi:MAG TPA: hypothetical protein ENK05_03535 [Gammaproteobacteria bacterium]|nr:hypothetical protein [Gammaproteobacteria bacterium]